MSLVVLAISLLHCPSRAPLSEVIATPNNMSWSCAAAGAVNIHLCPGMCGSVLPVQQGRPVHGAHRAVRSDSGHCWLRGWLILQADGRSVLGPKHPANVCDVLWAAVCGVLHQQHCGHRIPGKPGYFVWTLHNMARSAIRRLCKSRAASLPLPFSPPAANQA